MSEWWSYRLSDFLLFSPQTYFRLFELHNQALWPWQIAASIAGLAMLALVGQRPALLIAGAAWLLVAWLWLFENYATINWAATWLAAGFALQGLLLWIAVFTARPRPFSGLGRPFGFLLMVCALVLQPLLPLLLERPWQQGEVFAITPGPTVVATLGLLLAQRAPWWLLVLPLLWCAIDGATLWTLQAPEAALLPAAGLLTMLLRALPLRRRD